SVIKKQTNRNPIELIKFLRNHSDIETTNIYINIPEESLELINKQLFELGNFGFLYDGMSIVLSMEKERNKNSSNEKALMVKKVLMSLSITEQVSGFLNALFKERNIALDLLSEMPLEDIRSKFTLLNLGLMPAKSDDFQCLISESDCPFGSRECQSCPISIPNIYTLNSIGRRINKKISEFAEKFPHTAYKA